MHKWISVIILVLAIAGAIVAQHYNIDIAGLLDNASDIKESLESLTKDLDPGLPPTDTEGTPIQ